MRFTILEFGWSRWDFDKWFTLLEIQTEKRSVALLSCEYRGPFGWRFEIGFGALVIDSEKKDY